MSKRTTTTSPHKWILFDIGGVLEVVDDDSWPRRLTESWATRLGLAPDVLAAQLAQLSPPRAATGTRQQDAWWNAIDEEFSLGTGRREEMRKEFWDAYCGMPNSTLIDYARALRGRVGLAILSNSADGAREEEERRYAFSEIFDPICYSHELGAAKPEVDAYTLTLDALHASPEDVFFIDDRAENITAAAALGIRGVLHTSNSQTIAAIDTFLAAR